MMDGKLAVKLLTCMHILIVIFVLAHVATRLYEFLAIKAKSEQKCAN